MQQLETVVGIKQNTAEKSRRENFKHLLRKLGNWIMRLFLMPTGSDVVTFQDTVSMYFISPVARWIPTSPLANYNDSHKHINLTKYGGGLSHTIASLWTQSQLVAEGAFGFMLSRFRTNKSLSFTAYTTVCNMHFKACTRWALRALSCWVRSCCKNCTFFQSDAETECSVIQRNEKLVLFAHLRFMLPMLYYFLSILNP